MLDFKEIHVIVKMNFSDDTLYQALLVFISVTHLWVPQIRKSYSVSDSFFFLTKQNKKSWMLPTSKTIQSTTNTLT